MLWLARVALSAGSTPVIAVSSADASATVRAVEARRQPPPPPPAAIEPETQRAPSPATAGPLKDAFLEEVRKVKKFFHGTVVAQAQSIEQDGDRIVFTFGPHHKALRAQFEQNRPLLEDIASRLATNGDFVRLQTLPGIGPILAMLILAEARDLRRFGCARQFLKYCGFDLCTEQSGQSRGQTHLSKRGNARLRYAFWLAGAVAIRMQQNSFRRKFEDYIRPDPKNADRRRKAYTAVAAKLARVAYAMITTGTDYRRFPEATRPSGRIPSPRAVEASTS